MILILQIAAGILLAAFVMFCLWMVAHLIKVLIESRHLRGDDNSN
jgi:hypothetical protein